MTPSGCPGCRAPMQRRALAGRYGAGVQVDVCGTCRGIWFDGLESSQLAPGAVIELFGLIHAEAQSDAQPLGDVLECPRCDGLLALTHDLIHTTRITYYRCTHGHGRFTTFYQFLREKQFVRELTPAETTQLRAQVGQVRCSSCGAPIDLARDAQCAYCHMPLSILDPDALKRTLAELAQAERHRATVDPTAPMQALVAGERLGRRLDAYERGAALGSWAAFAPPDALHAGDLVSSAIRFLMTD